MATQKNSNLVKKVDYEDVVGKGTQILYGISKDEVWIVLVRDDYAVVLDNSSEVDEGYQKVFDVNLIAVLVLEEDSLEA